MSPSDGHDSGAAPITWRIDVPDVAYARSGDVAVAYQVLGDGPADLVLVPFHASIFTLWFQPGFAAFAGRLAQGQRLIVVNPRGVGLSDRPRGFTVESRMDDVRAVMDAVGSEHAAVLGMAEAAATCALFAASYPERVSQLILFTPYGRGVTSEAERQEVLERIRFDREHWGEREPLIAMARQLNPQWADSADYLEWFIWHHRLTSSPASIVEFRRMTLDLDISGALPAVRVPTLVMSKEKTRAESMEVAQLIPGARLVHIPGSGMAITENDFAIEAVEDFLSGVAGSTPRHIPDTVLATLLFTDLVASTERAAEMGDRRWRELLAEQRTLVRRELVRYRGEEVDTAGDGFFARFDGPARAILCAQEVIRRTADLGLELRAGIHTGECELVDGKPAGLSVHVGARVSGEARPGEVLVSSTVKDLVAGSGIRFAERGTFELKGVPENWTLYSVEDGQATGA
jgi:class 3 adenylate cyclase/pimeloyl-ACP methyl ester carboxylesterase